MEKKLSNTAPISSEARAQIYGLLTRIFAKEIDKQFLQELRSKEFRESLTGLGANLGDSFYEVPEMELLENLAVEYARLFLGPDKPISPHESVHHQREDGDWGSLWGKDTVEVKKIIESSGLNLKAELNDIPDHLAVELEFLQKLILQETENRHTNDLKGMHRCIKLETQFIQEHLAPWVPEFCELVIKKSQIAFYSQIAEITKNFVLYEKENLENSAYYQQEEG
ncbi:MAG: hypothetical protein HN351_08740 [Deltaproteobacteria bacterium]|jgi:TorA maturation chaperone TorD|nr:hypothetical protein [Deltaproteobacteria bacterium]MBT4068753.1 hypothetical protein [Candidatus Neomarinimicrobiota bacterium]MBT5175257.1 hypothetical protein [Candidatus Neomarinimicrobiota bacterium]MBT6637507.1 hypothetical protein [Candidatus Neomarinimicrobiota bacterium]